MQCKSGNTLETMQDGDVTIQITNRKLYDCCLSSRVFQMTLSHCQGHSSIASSFKCSLREAVYKISTDSVLRGPSAINELLCPNFARRDTPLQLDTLVWAWIGKLTKWR